MRGGRAAYRAKGGDRTGVPDARGRAGSGRTRDEIWHRGPFFEAGGFRDRAARAAKVFGRLRGRRGAKSARGVYAAPALAVEAWSERSPARCHSHEPQAYAGTLRTWGEGARGPGGCGATRNSIRAQAWEWRQGW